MPETQQHPASREHLAFFLCPVFTVAPHICFNTWAASQESALSCPLRRLEHGPEDQVSLSALYQKMKTRQLCELPGTQESGCLQPPPQTGIFSHFLAFISQLNPIFHCPPPLLLSKNNLTFHCILFPPRLTLKSTELLVEGHLLKMEILSPVSGGTL